MNSLRRDPDSEVVTFADFDDAMAATIPSITSEMEKWYKQTDKRFKEREKPPMTNVYVMPVNDRLIPTTIVEALGRSGALTVGLPCALV